MVLPCNYLSKHTYNLNKLAYLKYAYSSSMQISHTNNNLAFTNYSICHMKRSQDDSRFEEYLSESKVEDELLLLWRPVVELALMSSPPSPRIAMEAAVDGGRRGEGRRAGKV
jgi:hypothetical protein